MYDGLLPHHPEAVLRLGRLLRFVQRPQTVGPQLVLLAAGMQLRLTYLPGGNR